MTYIDVFDSKRSFVKTKKRLEGWRERSNLFGVLVWISPLFSKKRADPFDDVQVPPFRTGKKASL